MRQILELVWSMRLAVIRGILTKKAEVKQYKRQKLQVIGSKTTGELGLETQATLLRIEAPRLCSLEMKKNKDLRHFIR